MSDTTHGEVPALCVFGVICTQLINIRSYLGVCMEKHNNLTLGMSVQSQYLQFYFSVAEYLLCSRMYWIFFPLGMRVQFELLPWDVGRFARLHMRRTTKSFLLPSVLNCLSDQSKVFTWVEKL